MDLSEFLLARIAEDEAVAQDQSANLDIVYAEYDPDDFQKRFSPARVLAECESKRRIVRAHEKWCHGVHETQYPTMDYDASYWWTLQVLANPYKDHPDYDESWRP